MRLIKGAGIYLIVWYGGAWNYKDGYLKYSSPEQVPPKSKIRAKLTALFRK